MATTIINAADLVKVNEISNLFRKGCNTTIVIAKNCDDLMNKGRGANRNPYVGRLTKVETYGGWCLGVDYSNACQNAAIASFQFHKGTINTHCFWIIISFILNRICQCKVKKSY